jgi:hypothetical protein
MEDGRSFKRKEGKKEQKTAWGSRRSRGGVLLVRRRGSSLSFPPLLHPSKKKKGGGEGRLKIRERVRGKKARGLPYKSQYTCSCCLATRCGVRHRKSLLTILLCVCVFSPYNVCSSKEVDATRAQHKQKIK